MATAYEDVLLEWRTFEGELIESRMDHRVVFRPRNGQPSIRHMGGRKPLTSDDPPTVVFQPLTPPMDCSFETQILNPVTEIHRPVRLIEALRTPADDGWRCTTCRTVGVCDTWQALPESVRALEGATDAE